MMFALCLILTVLAISWAVPRPSWSRPRAAAGPGESSRCGHDRVGAGMTRRDRQSVAMIAAANALDGPRGAMLAGCGVMIVLTLVRLVAQRRRLRPTLQDPGGGVEGV